MYASFVYFDYKSKGLLVTFRDSTLLHMNWCLFCLDSCFYFTHSQNTLIDDKRGNENKGC